MKSKLLSTILIGILLVSACAGSEGAPAAPAGGTLERVQQTGVVRIGIRFDFPPVSYIDESGNWIGFDVDIAEEIAKRLGVTLERVRVDETTRITFLQSGQIDLAVASMNHTRKREDAVDFSQSYFWGNQTFLVQSGKYEKLEELFGQTVAMNKGSSAIDGWKKWAEAHGGQAGQIVEFSDKQEALQALKSGAVEGYGEDNIPLLGLAAGDPNLVLAPGGFNAVRYGIGLPENDSNWRDSINLILQDMVADGVFQTIYDRWFGPTTSTPWPLQPDAPEIWP
ncbi:MAG: transporter substrate-binding domain-containing protein [Anaerolineae bacterium]